MRTVTEEAAVSAFWIVIASMSRTVEAGGAAQIVTAAGPFDSEVAVAPLYAVEDLSE
jgi:hypothetical protein